MMPNWLPKQLVNCSQLLPLDIHLEHVGGIPALPTWFSQLTLLETRSTVV